MLSDSPTALTHAKMQITPAQAVAHSWDPIANQQTEDLKFDSERFGILRFQEAYDDINE